MTQDMNETYGHRAHLASSWQALGKVLARCWHTLSCSMSLLRVWQEYGKEQARSSLEYGKEQARSRQGAGKSMLRVCLGHAGRIQAEFGENSRRIQGEFRLNSQRMHLLRFAACLILIVVGVGEMWGQTLPFEVTTADDITNHSEKFYWIESAGATGFYAVPHSNNSNASTTNAPTLRALWYFMESGEDGYYYIINKETGKYLKKTGNTGSDNTIGVADYAAADDAKFKFSFGTPTGIIEGYWVIYPKEAGTAGWLSKKSGNLQYNLWLKVSNWNNTPVGDLNSQWKIVARDNIQWPQSGLPFVVSTNSEKHYYRINHAQNTSFNISYDGNNYVTISTELDNKTAWYFEEAATDPSIDNLKYYYIVNASSGKYLKFTATTINGSNQNDMFTLSNYTEGDADRFQFVVVNSYGGNAGYSIMPKLAMSKYDVSNYANSMVPGSVANNEKLDLRSDRNNDNAHWTFEAVWGNPVVTCDENGTITITGEDGANLYYTTDGSTVPTTENLLYNESSKPTVSEGITTIKVRAIANEKSPSGVVTQKIVYVPNQTFSSTYNGNTQVPIVEVNNTTISSDEFNVSYQQGGNDVLECKNAGIYTVEITDKDGGEYIVYGSGSFTISPKAVTITANDASKEYDGTALTESGFTTSALEAGDTHTFTVVMTAGSTITDVSSTPNVIATVDGTAVTTGTPTAVGNYTVTTANGTLTVSIAHVTLTANSGTETYDGTEKTVTGYTCSVNGLTFEGVSANGSGTNAGTYDVTFTGVTLNTTTDESGNYVITNTVTGTLTINPAEVTLTANSGTETYDRTEKTVSGYTCSVDDLTFVGVSASRSETNAGTYDVTFTGVTLNSTKDESGNYVVAVATPGTLTINPKTLTITPDADQYKGFGDDDPVLTYTYSGLVEGDEIAFNGALGREEGEDVGTYEINLYNLTSANSNYVLALTEEPVVYFTIMKSVGNESMAEGFKLEIGEGGDIILKDGETLLAEGTDYTISTPEPGKYTERTVSGSGSYTGSFTFTNANVSFQTDANELEWSATFVAEPIGGGDADDTKGHALPDGMKAFIITDIDGDWAIPEQLNYIPEGVPVLLVSDKESGGFIVKDATPTDEQKIKGTQKEANMLKVTTSTTHFDIKTIFLLYKNEFIYNMSGDLAAGKVYLNPPSGSSPAPSRLRIKKKDDTGIEDTHFLPLTSHLSDVWYTLDGRRLNGKPMERGLYIVNGKKVMVK